MSESSTDEYIKEQIAFWTGKMDEVFKSHVGKSVAPYTLTNKEHVLAICLGMGIAGFEIEGELMVLKTHQPTCIRWNGKKFDVIIMKDNESRD